MGTHRWKLTCEQDGRASNKSEDIYGPSPAAAGLRAEAARPCRPAKLKVRPGQVRAGRGRTGQGRARAAQGELKRLARER